MKDFSRPITAEGVRDAAKRLHGVTVRTPLIENLKLNEIARARIFLKAEVLQHYGSFKLRGAYNLLSQLSEDERKNGVLAWSSGNHAQGVAYAAKQLGCPATIVMPADAPSIKANNVRALGAEIITYDRYTENREEMGKRIASERNMVVAPSYDHPNIIEGQGTVALEAIAQAQDVGVDLESFVICCGGGGLTAGCATILEDISAHTEVWIAEPEGYDETWASIRSGERQYADVSKPTVCDAIATPTPGALTLPILQRRVRGGATLSEQDVANAMRFAFEHLKLIVEPGGAVALAAILSGKINSDAKAICVTLSGGNVDRETFISLTK